MPCKRCVIDLKRLIDARTHDTLDCPIEIDIKPTGLNKVFREPRFWKNAFGDKGYNFEKNCILDKPGGVTAVLRAALVAANFDLDKDKIMMDREDEERRANAGPSFPRCDSTGQTDVNYYLCNANPTSPFLWSNISTKADKITAEAQWVIRLFNK